MCSVVLGENCFHENLSEKSQDITSLPENGIWTRCLELSENKNTFHLFLNDVAFDKPRVVISIKDTIVEKSPFKSYKSYKII